MQLKQSEQKTQVKQALNSSFSIPSMESSAFKEGLMKTTELLDTIRQQRDILFENKLSNGFKDHKELEKLTKK